MDAQLKKLEKDLAGIEEEISQTSKMIADIEKLDEGDPFRDTERARLPALEKSLAALRADRAAVREKEVFLLKQAAAAVVPNVAPTGSVLGGPLPRMVYIASSTHRPSTTWYRAHPAAARVWDVEDDILKQQLPTGNMPIVQELITQVFSVESGVDSHLTSAVIETLNRAIARSKYASTGAQWVQDPAVSSYARQEVDESTAALRKPDFVLMVNGRCVAFIETKRLEVLQGLEEGSLATAWNNDVAQCNTSSSSIAVISQVTTYAAGLGLRHGAITTYEHTWLLHFMPDTNTLEVSRAFAWDSTHPSTLQGLWHLTVLVLEQQEPLRPWTPLTEPPGCPPRTPKPRTRRVQAAPSSNGSSDGSSGWPQGRYQDGGPSVAGPAPPSGSGGDGNGDGSSSSHASAASLAQEDWCMEEELKDKRVIGHGMTGSVVGGSVRGVAVAVKASNDPELIEQLWDEAEFLDQLGALPPPLVTPRRLGEGWVRHGNGYWLATELLEGHTLDLVAHPEDAALLPAASASLARIHAAGVLHGDIRPENLMVVPAAQPGAPPRVMWLDFGLAERNTDPEAHAHEQYLLQRMFTLPTTLVDS